MNDEPIYFGRYGFSRSFARRRATSFKEVGVKRVYQNRYREGEAPAELDASCGSSSAGASPSRVAEAAEASDVVEILEGFL